MPELDPFRHTADYLQRMAPTQPHDGRHALLAVAKFLRGLEITKESPHFVSIPVFDDGVLMGQIDLLVELQPDGVIRHSTQFVRHDDLVVISQAIEQHDKRKELTDVVDRSAVFVIDDGSLHEGGTSPGSDSDTAV